jgi:hypothetical protein
VSGVSPAAGLKPGKFELNPDPVINHQKIPASPYVTQDCVKVGHRSNLGIQGFRNLGIEGILSILIY